MKKVTILLAIILLPISSAFSLPPLNLLNETVNQDKSVQTIDNSTYIDANNILSFVTNTGTIGRDLSGVFGYDAGFFYPFTTVDDIYNGTNDNYCIYSMGLWLGGKINDEIHVTVCEYSTEFVPGQMEGGTYVPDNYGFRVYKIDETSGPGDPDYDNWPITHGAPVDSLGNIMLLGDQTLWAVYNDADPDQHNNGSGETDPMGIEVQQTVWGSDDPGEEDVLYIKYKLYNKGSNYIDSFYISFWVDPDIGGAGDDLVGCDTLNNIFFSYNATNNDQYYGSTPPAVGGYLVSGPVVPSSGDYAMFDGNILPDYKNIGMSSFNKYINGIDPDDAQQSYFYMLGLNRDGSPFSYNGTITKFACSGNPITGTGWIDGYDTPPSDRRMMANFGPFDFNPGDSQQVILKIGVGRGTDRLYSLCNLKNTLNNACEQEPEYVAANYLQTAIKDESDLQNAFFVGDSYWLYGYNWGGRYFYRSADYGSEFWGGYLNPLIMPDSFNSVEIRFTDNDPLAGQRAYRYCRGCIDHYGYQDYAWVPFQVWDTDHNRQLNACFVEWIDSDVYDGTWSPDYSDDGGREYLFIMNSDYDGNLSSAAGTGEIDYTSLNIDTDHAQFDIQYAFWPKLRFYHNLSEMQAGEKLAFYYSHQINMDSLADSIIIENNSVGVSSYQQINLKCLTDGLSIINTEITDQFNFNVSKTNIMFFDGDTTSIIVYYTPTTPGSHTAYLYLRDQVSGIIMKTYKVIGKSDITTEVDNNGDLLASDYRLSQNYPNPFNPITKIEFSLGSRQEIKINIYNILGQKIITLINSTFPAGSHFVEWNGTDVNGETVASGIYFYQLETETYTESKKMILLK
ncbi:MAG: T9SS type A sorting domain-containing protein [Candidatus Zixiibacteriota bacterium]